MTSTAIKKPAFKVGQKIKVRKTGAVGKVVDVVSLANGLWLAVEFGDKKKSNIKRVRPSLVDKA